jgi:hypothetical protein
MSLGAARDDVWITLRDQRWSAPASGIQHLTRRPGNDGFFVPVSCAFAQNGWLVLGSGAHPLGAVTMTGVMAEKYARLYRIGQSVHHSMGGSVSSLQRSGC